MKVGIGAKTPRLGGTVYLLPNLLTTGNLFFGFFSIIKALQGRRSTREELVALVYAATPKALHGAAARTLEAHLIYLEEQGVIKSDGNRFTLL